MKAWMKALIVFAHLVLGINVSFGQDFSGTWNWFANGFKGELYLSQNGPQIHGWIGFNGVNLYQDVIAGSVTAKKILFTRTSPHLVRPQEYAGYLLAANQQQIEVRQRMTGADAIAGTFIHHGFPTAGWYALRAGPYRENPTAASSGLTGTWTGYWTNRPNEPLAAQILSQGSQLVLVNNVGDHCPATLESPTTILASKWNIRGTIAADGRRIDWSNGSYWIKGAVPTSSPSLSPPLTKTPTPPSLAGTWTGYWTNRPNEPLAAQILSQGSQLVLVNNVGDHCQAIFESPTAILASKWNIRGTIASDGRRIDWSNGSYWIRKQ